MPGLTSVKLCATTYGACLDRSIWTWTLGLDRRPRLIVSVSETFPESPFGMERNFQYDQKNDTSTDCNMYKLISATNNGP